MMAVQRIFLVIGGPHNGMAFRPIDGVPREGQVLELEGGEFDYVAACGPEPMMVNVSEALEKLTVEPSSLMKWESCRCLHRRVCFEYLKAVNLSR